MAALVHRAGQDPLAEVRDWLTRPALHKLVEMFGGRPPAECQGGLRERLTALEAFSEVWDRRKGGSRLTIAQDDRTLPVDKILFCAQQLTSSCTVSGETSRIAVGLGIHIGRAEARSAVC
ncbi:hypothetical protein ACWDCO_33065 [Streptomyces albogriseolus]